VIVLEVADVEPYLRARGLLEAGAVVDGRLRVVDASRRNRVFLVTADRQPCYVVKLPREPGDTGVEYEAAVLDGLRSRLGDDRLTAFVPTPVIYDAAENVLVLELPPNAQDLTQQHARSRFSRALAGATGKALAALHSVAAGVLDGLRAPDPTAMLAVHRPDMQAVRTLSEAGVDLVRMIQGSDALCRALDELLGCRRDESVIHGDMRWDNCLAVGRPDSRRKTRVLLIDWELSAAADPALDVGAYFAEYLRAWQQSVAIWDARRTERRPIDPTRLLAAMQPAVGAFWEAYERHSNQPAIELSRMLRRALQFAGARLVLTALEEAQTMTELGHSVLSTLQLGANVLQRPDEAGVHLLGFRTRWIRT
jgi:aminoglycoside phosphotransferase (APT) family kinase protein